jgi:hypothetical protein
MQHLNELLKTILGMLEKQSEAITRLTEAQLNLTFNQSTVLTRHDHLIRLNSDWLAVQNEVAERQRDILNNYENLIQLLEHQHGEHSKLEGFVRLMHDLYTDELRVLKRRVTQLENPDTPHEAATDTLD